VQAAGMAGGLQSSAAERKDPGYFVDLWRLEGKPPYLTVL